MPNIVADGQAENEFISRVLNFLQKLLDERKRKGDKNAQIISDYIKRNGKLSYKLVPNHMKEKMLEELKKNNIPYTDSYDNMGNLIIFTRKCDDERFYRIQHDVFSMDANYYAQTSINEFCRIAKNNKEDSLIALNFGTKEDFNEAQVKLYGRNVVCTLLGDDKTLYINPSDIYKENGDDLFSFEVEWAVNQSMNDAIFGNEIDEYGNKKDTKFQELRDAQANHDMQMIKAFSEAVQKGEQKVLVDATNGSKHYLESGLDGLHIYEMNPANGKFAEKNFINREVLLNAYKADGIGNLISKWGFDITNSIVINSYEKNNVINATKTEASEWSKAWANQKTTDGKDILVRKGFVRQLRPTGGFRGKDAEIQNIKTHELKQVFTAVEREARLRVNSLYENHPQSFKRVEVKKIFAQLIEAGIQDPTNSVPKEIGEFINGAHSYLNSEDKKEWLKNIESHILSENELGKHEVNIHDEKIKDVQRKATEIIREKEAEKEMESKADSKEIPNEINTKE